MFENLSADIIAGGKSARFGEHKGLAVLNSRQMIDYSIVLAKEIGFSQFLVYGKENYFDQIDIPCYSDIIPHCGPMGGIYTALVKAQTNLVATIPCDMPFLTAEVYRLLYDNYGENKPVIAVSENGVESLVAIWPKTYESKLRDAIHKKVFTIHAFIQNNDIPKISIPELMPDYEEKIFLNINTKEDLAAIQKNSYWSK